MVGHPVHESSTAKPCALAGEGDEAEPLEVGDRSGNAADDDEK
jgi:hypothetical protein